MRCSWLLPVNNHMRLLLQDQQINCKLSRLIVSLIITTHNMSLNNVIENTEVMNVAACDPVMIQNSPTSSYGL
eukprot:1390489-Amphidinium_carterae.1